MNSKNLPNLVIVAGPNGAGKSTVAEFLLKNKSLRSYTNADVIAHGMKHSPEDPASEIRAGKIMLQELHSAIRRSSDVAFESTMAGKSWISLIKEATKIGYEVTICYVALNSPQLAVERVQARVRDGGHAIPPATILRRYKRSLEGFFTCYSKLAHNWYFFDNTGDRASLLAMKEGQDPVNILEADIYGSYLRGVG